MKKFRYLVIALVGILIFYACQKETSFETGTLTGNAVGSLQNLAGECQDITVAGQYIKDSTLGDSSYVTVQVNFSTPGLYNIYTDTVNGFSFRDSGYIVSAGLQSIVLKAAGTPLVTQETSFAVYLDTSFCMFTVNVTDTAVVRRDAEYTLASTGSTCANATLEGAYAAGTALNSNNTVSIDLNVTSPGSYTISTTPTNGMTFAAQGTFTTTGLVTVALKGSGTPVTAQTDSIPITAGGTSCKFEVVVAAGTGTGGTGGSGSGTNANNSWSFNHGSAFTQGSIDLALLNANPIGTGSVFTLTGRNANADSAITFLMLLPGSTITPGTFKTNQGSSTLFSLNKTTGDPIYTSNSTTPNAVMTIVIVSYDATTKIVTGTFSGNVENEATGNVVAITNGKFRATL